MRGRAVRTLLVLAAFALAPAAAAGDLPAGLVDGASEPLDEVFGMLDANRDGELSARESSALIESKEDRPLDLNADGKITRDEYRASFARVREMYVNSLLNGGRRGAQEAERRAVEGDTAGALSSLRELVKRMEEDPIPHLAIGTVLRRAGRLQEAQAETERAVELGPGNSAGWLELAILHDASGRGKERDGALQQAIERLRFEMSFDSADLEARETYLERRILSAASYFLAKGKPGLARKILEPSVRVLGSSSALAQVLAELGAKP